MVERPLAAAFAAALVLLGGHPARADGPLEPQGRWTAVVTGNARLPPMGWASWNAFNLDITEARLLASAQVLVTSGLAGRGYRYVDVDDGWWLGRRADGRMLVRTNLFPQRRGRRGKFHLAALHRQAARDGPEGRHLQRYRP